MKVLVIGAGGREHAICAALGKSPKVTEIYCAPGNAGIARIAHCVAIGDTEQQPDTNEPYAQQREDITDAVGNIALGNPTQF